MEAGQQDAVPPALHRTIVCVDVEGFSSRLNPDQIEVRAALYTALQQAFAESGIPWPGGGSYHEDRGDGAIILIPPTVPKSLLTTAFPRELATALRQHNQVATPETQMRLRVALHAGEVHFDANGAVATALNFTFRMLDAEALKRALRDSSGVLALITSEWFFEEVIRHDRACAALYRQARVEVEVKETRGTAWIWLPDDPAWPPGEQALLASAAREQVTPGPGGKTPLAAHRRHAIGRRPVIISSIVMAVIGLVIAFTAFGIPDRSAAPGGPVRWTYATGSWVESSLAVAGSTVYIGSDNGKVYALDATTGHVRWTHSTGGNVDSRSAVAGGTVYIASDNGMVYALDATTGHVRWTHSTGGPIRSSPAVAGGTVYIGSDNHKVYALDATTGHVRWTLSTYGPVESSPAVADGFVCVGSDDDMVYALDATTSHISWFHPTGGPVRSSPAMAGGTVYIGSDDHKVYALDVATSTPRWSHPTGGPVRSSPAVAGGTVYIGSDDHKVYALDATTGRVRWIYSTGGPVRSSPAVAGGTVYIGSDDHKVYALNAGPNFPRGSAAGGGSGSSP